MKFTSPIIAFIFVCLISTQTFACRCRPRTFVEVCEQVDLIFKGTIVKIDTIDNVEIATFDIEKLYKGLVLGSTTSIIVRSTNCDAIGAPRIGKEYFLFARRYNSSYSASYCDLPSDINTANVQSSLDKMTLSIQKKD